MYSTSQFRLAAFQVLRSCLWGAAATGNRAAQSTECHAFQWWMQRSPFAPATTIELQWAFLHMRCYTPSWGLLWDKHPETGLLGHRGIWTLLIWPPPDQSPECLQHSTQCIKLPIFPYSHQNLTVSCFLIFSLFSAGLIGIKWYLCCFNLQLYNFNLQFNLLIMSFSISSYTYYAFMNSLLRITCPYFLPILVLEFSSFSCWFMVVCIA